MVADRPNNLLLSRAKPEGLADVDAFRNLQKLVGKLDYKIAD